MTLTVNLAKSMQAIAYIKRHGVFHNWNLASEYRGDNPDGRLEFGINLGAAILWTNASPQLVFTRTVPPCLH